MPPLLHVTFRFTGTSPARSVCLTTISFELVALLQSRGTNKDSFLETQNEFVHTELTAKTPKLGFPRLVASSMDI